MQSSFYNEEELRWKRLQFGPAFYEARRGGAGPEAKKHAVRLRCLTAMRNQRTFGADGSQQPLINRYTTYQRAFYGDTVLLQHEPKSATRFLGTS